ncbi:hypothetical protein GCK72_003168 [Caenorhabditis remanei]|uniref:Sdz-33 F-box domain-containing protein n=1 Tax=Caenorhabditis remanei TaxID=31234 RepID=A0A6A5HYK0_CAERE|nr:hypothetical protein GCK72_003168 [Caenorhabditis remanei]KAF1771342.1 hypothetical protein GCK72_003168 [Caenorhabditis remanei]
MLFDLQVKFKRISIKLDGSEDRVLLWNQISKKLELVEDLVIFSGMNQLTPVFASWPQNITITNSAWITLEHLLACTCTRITLSSTHLENKDLDIILKNWKTGGFPNLNYLKIHSHRITNIGATILGMSWSELEGKVIQTDDGLKKATIRIENQWFEMSVTRFE